MADARIRRDAIGVARDASEVAFRPAREEDVPQIVAIERDSFGDPWSQGSFRSLIGNPHVHFTVAVQEDRVLGYLIAWFVMEEAEIANLAVAAPARGRRVAARLLDADLEAASRRGVASIFLEVRDSNARARALYASRGFEEVGRRRRYYRRPVEDAVVMRRALASDPRAPR